MSSAIRAVPPERFQSTIPTLNIARPRLINLILIIGLLLSAFIVIYLKDLNRRLFIQNQSLQITHDKLYEDWEKLLLEQSTWSSQARVKKIAKKRLGMHIPSAKEVVVLRVHGTTHLN